MADDKKPDDKGEQATMRGQREPVFDAKADKLYEQRRAGLLPPDSLADRIVLAAREARARVQAAARRAREEAGRVRRAGESEAP